MGGLRIVSKNDINFMGAEAFDIRRGLVDVMNGFEFPLHAIYTVTGVLPWLKSMGIKVRGGWVYFVFMRHFFKVDHFGLNSGL